MDIQILRKVVDTFKRLKSSALKSCFGNLGGRGEGRGHPDPEKRGGQSPKKFSFGPVSLSLV